MIRTKYFPKFATLAVAMVCFFSVISSTKAQCPDSTMPYPGPAWIGPFTLPEIIPGTSCLVYVTFCERWEGGVLAVYFENVSPSGTDTACHSLSPGDIIRGGIYAVLHDPALITTPCSQGTTVIISTAAKCWTAHAKPDPSTYHYWFGPCGTAYCTQTCSYCVDAYGHVQDQGCTTITYGEGSCPGWGYVWSAEECYATFCN